ncbi:MAG TPA: glycosyltransferase family 39 protein [Planctomycetota bacterium]|nr:glycosyltransferase family 39 protein [Planctomycetota bacterium]
MLAALLPALFSIWLYWPACDGGLLSDDLALMGYLVQPGPSGPELHWHRVYDDFVGPWAFGSFAFYRPLVTLSLAVEYWAGNGAEWVFHTSCVVAFALTVMSCGVLFGMLAGRAAAFAGALLLAAHPAAHEPICWMCTRADFMVLMASAWACIGFVNYLRHGRRRHLFGTVVASVLALLSKEPGILLAVWFLLLDLAERGNRVSLRTRLWLHLRLAPLWILYLGWRWCTLGILVGSEAPAAAHGTASIWLALQAAKLRACVAPFGSHLPATTAVTTGLLVGWVVLLGWFWPGNRRFIALGVVWMLLGFLPAQWLPITANFWGGRIVLMSFVGVALVVGTVLGGNGGPRWFRCVGTALLGLAVVDLAIGTRALQAEYVKSWAHMRVLREQIDAAGSRATVEQPLVLLFAKNHECEHPFLEPEMAFPIVETPLASADHPFVSLCHSFHGVGVRWLLEREVGPMRTMWQHGARLCYWSTRFTQGQLALVPSPQETGPIELLPGADGTFLVQGGAASPWPIAGVRVASAAPFAGGELTWLGAQRGEDTGVVQIGRAQRGVHDWFAEVDLSEDFDFLIRGAIGKGIVGFSATLVPTSAETALATALQVIAPVPGAPLSSPLRGARLTFGELLERPLWSSVPADAESGSAAIVLMNGWCPLRIPFVDGRLRPLLDLSVVSFELRRWIHVDRFYYYLECRHGGRAWRSAVDWFVLDGG